MRRVPNDPAILDEKGLRRLVPDAETDGNRVRQSAILDDENDAARQAAKAFGEAGELLVHLRADRTLRAMLENKNGFGLRPLQELFEVLILP